MKKILSLLIVCVLLMSFCISISAEELLDKENWDVRVSSLYQASDANLIKDGDISTYWHSAYTAEGGAITGKDNPPFYIYIEFPAEQVISGFIYTPRVDNTNGTARTYNFYASSDGKTAYLIDSGEGILDKTAYTKDFGKSYKVKGVVFEITSSVGSFGTCAEFDLIKGSGSTASLPKGTSVSMSGGATTPVINTEETEKPAEKTESTGNTGSYLDKSSFNVEVSSLYDASSADFLKDGDISTYWHSAYTAEGGAITGKDNPPFYIYIKFPSEQVISGFTYTPRVDNTNGTARTYNFYASSDGKTAYLIDSGEGILDKTAYTKDFGKSYKVKGVVFEITSSVGSFGTCAEFDLIKGSGSVAEIPEGKALDMQSGAKAESGNDTKEAESVIGRDGWKLSVNSIVDGYDVSLMIDGNKGTYWHSNYKAEGKTIVSHDNPPYFITVELPKAEYISGLIYTPRQDQDTGRFKNYKVYVADSVDGERYFVGEGEFANNTADKIVDFALNVKAKVVILETYDTCGGYGTLAELNLRSAKEDYKNAESAKDYELVMRELRDYKVNTEGFVTTDNSNWGENSESRQLFDGNKQSIWHSNPDDRGKFEFEIKVDMGKVHTLTALDYVPRYNDTQGYLYNFSVLASVDGKEYYPVSKENFVTEKEKADKVTVRHFEFDEKTEARFLKFIIHESENGHAAAGEFILYETYESFEKANMKNTEKYVLAIGKNEIYTEFNEEKNTITLDVAPYIDNGRTMIPLRGLLEAMGASIEWQGDTRTIVVTKDVNVITLQIVNNLVYVYKYHGGEYRTIRYTLDVPPKIKDSRTFIPIRFVSEHLGYTVSWNGEKQEITIENK